MSSRTWPKTLTCVTCNNKFTVEKRSGPAPITCSDDCRRQRRNHKLAQWRENNDCPEQYHGTLTGYTNYLCDCELCRKAERDYMRDHRKSKQDDN